MPARAWTLRSSGFLERPGYTFQRSHGVVIIQSWLWLVGDGGQESQQVNPFPFLTTNELLRDISDELLRSERQSTQLHLLGNIPFWLNISFYFLSFFPCLILLSLDIDKMLVSELLFQVGFLLQGPGWRWLVIGCCVVAEDVAGLWWRMVLSWVKYYYWAWCKLRTYNCVLRKDTLVYDTLVHGIYDCHPMRLVFYSHYSQAPGDASVNRPSVLPVRSEYSTDNYAQLIVLDNKWQCAWLRISIQHLLSFFYILLIKETVCCVRPGAASDVMCLLYLLIASRATLNDWPAPSR